MAIRFNPQRHAYGLQSEQTLKPLLESVLGESLTKTRHQYDIMDFTSPSYFVELKTRSSTYHPTDYSTWLLPSCKGTEAEKNAANQKKTVFFYYWATTQELYLLEYEKTLFDSFHKDIPPWHADHQEHFYVPASDFSLVVFED